MNDTLKEEQKQENKKGFGKEVANILLNIPSNQRDWLTEFVPAEVFGMWCMYYDSKTVKTKIEFFMSNPDKMFWSKPNET
jgi:hypothetical protein